MGGRQAVFACYVVSCAFLTTLYTIVTTVPVGADSWPTSKIAASVVKFHVITDDGTSGWCSGFSQSEQHGRFVTANHCTIEKTVKIGDITFAVIDRVPEADLALLQTDRGGLPELRLGRAPKASDPLMAVGHSSVVPEPFWLPGTYQGTYDTPLGTGICAPCLVLSGNGYPGMSGGPIVNTSGEVVSVMIGGMNPNNMFQDISFGVPYAALRKLLLKWRED